MIQITAMRITEALDDKIRLCFCSDNQGVACVLANNWADALVVIQILDPKHIYVGTAKYDWYSTRFVPREAE